MTTSISAIKTKSRDICPVCRHEGSILYKDMKDYFLSTPGLWTINKCSNNSCSTLWLNPMPLEEEIWKAYQTYHTHSNANKKTTSDHIVSLIARLTKLLVLPISILNGLYLQRKKLRTMFLGKTGGRLLDVGCGGGRFLRRMKKNGWQVEGSDFDDQVANEVMDKYGIHVHIGDLKEINFSDNSFDAITLSHTIEHLYDPLESIKRCHQLLKKEGKLIVTTPNANSLSHQRYGKYWRGLEPPRHIQIFTANSLSNIIGQAGFSNKIVNTLSTGSAGIYKVSALASQKKSFFMKALRTIESIFLELVEQHDNNNDNGQDILIIATKE